jgi:hypothetical protein
MRKGVHQPADGDPHSQKLQETRRGILHPLQCRPLGQVSEGNQLQFNGKCISKHTPNRKNAGTMIGENEMPAFRDLSSGIPGDLTKLLELDGIPFA